MSQESVKRFLDKIADGQEVVLTVYEDANGLWAKDVGFVDRVRVKFADQETLFMTYPEVRALDKAAREVIDHAPSSP